MDFFKQFEGAQYHKIIQLFDVKLNQEYEQTINKYNLPKEFKQTNYINILQSLRKSKDLAKQYLHNFGEWIKIDSDNWKEFSQGLLTISDLSKDLSPDPSIEFQTVFETIDGGEDIKLSIATMILYMFELFRCFVHLPRPMIRAVFTEFLQYIHFQHEWCDLYLFEGFGKCIGLEIHDDNIIPITDADTEYYNISKYEHPMFSHVYRYQIANNIKSEVTYAHMIHFMQFCYDLTSTLYSYMNETIDNIRKTLKFAGLTKENQRLYMHRHYYMNELKKLGNKYSMLTPFSIKWLKQLHSNVVEGIAEIMCK